MPTVKTPVRERAKLRANEERKVLHAKAVLMQLLEKHDRDGRDAFELNLLCSRLIVAIKNQHISDESYAEFKARTARVKAEDF